MKKQEHLLSLNCVDAGLLAISCIKEYPHFYWVLKIDGDIDLDLLNQALQAVLAEHPNLRSRVCIRRMRPYRLIQEAGECKILHHVDLRQRAADDSTGRGASALLEGIIDELHNKSVDPFVDFPVMVLAIRGGGAESFLVFSIDHSALDGIRSLRFIRETVKKYNSGSKPEPRSLKDIPLGRGDELLKFARAKRASTPAFYRSIFVSLFHRCFIAPFNPPSRVIQRRRRQPRRLEHFADKLSYAETEQIRQKAKAAGSTTNDVLLAVCYRVTERWNSSHGKAARNIRIMVPIDIGPETFSNVISNQVTFISPSTLPKDRLDKSGLLQRIRGSMGSASGNGVPFAIVYLIYFATRVPFPVLKVLARLLMLTRVYVDTILLTNIGVSWPEAWGEPKVGNSGIADMTLIMPTVSPMGLSLGAHTYKGSLHISLTYEPSLFSREEAEEFLVSYLDELKSY